MNTIYRHGDVNLVSTTLPAGAKLVGEHQTLAIAFGETTGHNHTVVSQLSKTFLEYEYNGNRYLVLDTEATLTHPEHKTLTVFPGVYVQGQEREVDHFSKTTRKVID